MHSGITALIRKYKLNRDLALSDGRELPTRVRAYRRPPTPTISLRALYFTRFGFAVIWALLTALIAERSTIALVLFVVMYPLFDAAAVYVERAVSNSSSRLWSSETVNIVVSLVAAVGLGVAALDSVSSVLVVWGIWAVGSGATQLVSALGRRAAGGQWPLMFSGGLSILVGVTFLMQGLSGADGVGTIAGYATVGGILFLVSALRLTSILRHR
jgi:uncharacterized membrane protein HdeD (DUF308 family)